MHFSSIFAASAMASAALAVEHKVLVGTKAGDLVFKPDSLKAAEGDTVTFSFWPKNHSVAQATFANPCQVRRPMPKLPVRHTLTLSVET
jgi:plastocyanin